MNVQVKYQEYVRSMPPQCTPMALLEFCKLIDKAGRGVPDLRFVGCSSFSLRRK